MASDVIIKDLPKALISWYEFQKDSKVLFISGGKLECEVLFDAMKEKGIDPVKADAMQLHAINGKFDYIVAAGIIERSEMPKEVTPVSSAADSTTPITVTTVRARLFTNP